MREGDKLIERRPLDAPGAVLECVINGGGQEYSLIVVDGYEVLSAPTSDEAGLLRYWKENGDLFVRRGKRER